MLKNVPAEPDALGRGAYSAIESLRLLNFNRPGLPPVRRVSRNTVARWLRGYSHGEDGSRHLEPLWKSDCQNDDDQIELSFRDPNRAPFRQDISRPGCGPHETATVVRLMRSMTIGRFQRRDFGPTAKRSFWRSRKKITTAE